MRDDEPDVFASGHQVRIDVLYFCRQAIGKPFQKYFSVALPNGSFGIFVPKYERKSVVFISARYGIPKRCQVDQPAGARRNLRERVEPQIGVRASIQDAFGASSTHNSSG